jgi:hypothetical protein
MQIETEGKTREVKGGVIASIDASRSPHKVKGDDGSVYRVPTQGAVGIRKLKVGDRVELEYASGEWFAFPEIEKMESRMKTVWDLVEAVAIGKVDDSLWRISRKFGVAGGPDVFELTDEGGEKSFSVGAKVKPKDGAALLALNALGGEGDFEKPAGGARLRPTELMKWDMLTWGRLQNLGYIERMSPKFGDRGEILRGSAVRLTAKGKVAVLDGLEEMKRLLDRVRKQEGIQQENSMGTVRDVMGKLVERDFASSAWAPIPSGKDSPRWYQASQADDAVGQAYRAIHDLKADLDAMEEIPPHLKKIYAAIMAASNAVGKARKDTNQLRELARRAAEKIF